MDNHKILRRFDLEMESLRETKRHFSKLGMRLFLGALFCFVIQYIAMLLADRIAPAFMNNSDLSLIITMLPLYCIGMPVLAFLIRQLPATPVTKHKLSLGQWFTAFCICYGLMYASNLLGVFTTEIIGNLKGGTVENIVAELLSDISPWSAIPFMVILAPIFEELIFRKLIIDRTVKYGEGIAILVSATLFALFHGNLNQFAYAVVLGLFWGFLYVKTGTVKYTIFMHMSINFLGSVPGMLMMRSGFYQELLSIQDPSDLQTMLLFLSEHALELIFSFLYSLFIIIFALTGIVLFFVKRKNMHLCAGEITIPNGKRFRTIVLNLGMLLNTAYWGIQILLQLFH